MAVAPERITMMNTITAACANFAAWTSMSAPARESIVRRLERGCFNVAVESCEIDGLERSFNQKIGKKFVDRYGAACTRVIMNIDPTSAVGSDYLLACILRGEIEPSLVAKLRSEDLCPLANAAERNLIMARLNQQIEQKVCREYRCEKCKKNETTRTQYQGRAGDESSNESIVCINCGHYWRL